MQQKVLSLCYSCSPPLPRLNVIPENFRNIPFSFVFDLSNATHYRVPEVNVMISFFESFAQIGLPQEKPSRDASKKSKLKSDKICYMSDGEEVCFSHQELCFAVLW